MATRLVTKDSSELHSIEDVKVRDAVTRDLLKMSYAEASAIYGSNFDISKNNGDEPGSNKDNGDEDTPMARKVRQLEYRDALREKESAMSNFISKNGDLFAQGSDAMIARIDAELEFISNKLPIDERIKRAASIAMGSPVDTTSLAYSILQNASARKPNGSQQREDEEVKLTKFQEEIRDFFKTNK